MKKLLFIIDIKHVEFYFIYSLLCCWLTPVMAQNAIVATVGPNIYVAPGGGNHQTEVHLSIDKSNHSYLILSANIGSSATDQACTSSSDGGLTWSGHNNFLNETNTVSGDPSTAIDANGNMYVSTMNNNISTFSPPSDYYLAKSTDHGASWAVVSAGVGATDFDKEMIAADDEPLTISPYSGNVYCTYVDISQQTINFSAYSGSASTFISPTPYALWTSSGTSYGEGPNVQTGPNGEIYVCWANYPNSTGMANGFYFSESTSGPGSSSNFSTPILVNYDGYDIANGTRPNSDFAGTRVDCYPSMAVDKSCGPNNGYIYVAFGALDGSGNRVIQASYSTDGGMSWSTPSTISTSSSASNCFFPWITVDDVTGLVCVVYYNTDISSWSTNTWMAYSSDGGLTFTNKQVSTYAHILTPIDVTNGYAGDYIGITAHNGIAYPSWMDNISGTWLVCVSKVILGPYQINTTTTLSSDVTYQTNVEVTATNTLTIGSGVTVSMAPGCEIIVDPGATLVVNGTITNSCNGFWSGIELEGNNSLAQTSANQGTVILNSTSEIENALNGITTAGGIIQANGAWFYNNERDIQFLPYTNPPHPLLNSCIFNNCTFEVDQRYLGLVIHYYPLRERVLMTDVYGINFHGNTFENLIPTSGLGLILPNIYTRGCGIYSNDATYSVNTCNGCISLTGCCGTPNLFTGFQFGIYASNSNPAYNVEIEGNTFTDNYDDICVGDINNMIIADNSFSKTAYEGTNNCYPYCATPYNIYLDQSTAYYINGNSLSNSYYGIVSSDNSYGAIINNSGPTNNLINNNSFNDIYIQTQAQNMNGLTNYTYTGGLFYQCNQFNSTIKGGDDVVVINGTIDPVQGSCVNNLTTANNTFNNDCPNRTNILTSNLPYSYSTIIYKYANNISGPFPYCVSSDVLLNSCLLNLAGNCAESKYSINAKRGDVFKAEGIDYHSTFRIQKEYFKHLKDSLTCLLNKGKDRRLYTDIATLSPSAVQDSLLAPGPYLSDSVLIAAANSTLPPENLANVFIPNATLDSTLVSTLDNIYLPDTIVNRINEFQADTKVSPRNMLTEDIDYFQAQMDLTDNALITALLTDSTILSPYDSAQAVIESNYSLTLPQIAQLASLQWAAGENSNALATLNTLQSIDYDSTYYNYCTLLPVLMNLQNDSTGYSSLIGDSEDSAFIEQIAMDTLKPGYANARAVLESVYNQVFTKPILPISQNKAPQPKNNNNLFIHSKQESANSTIKSNTFNLFPNPASTTLTITYNLSQVSGATYLELYDLVGNKILTWTLSPLQTMLSKDISELPVGFYSYRIISNENILQRGKLVIAK